MKPESTSPRHRPTSQPKLRSSPPSAANASLKLPSLPRFHQANFSSSQHSSAGNTPVPGANNTTQSPVSPRQQHRQYTDILRQLHAYQRDIVVTAARGSRTTSPSGNGSARPDSPKLEPLGSPGPVTPLMLEDQGGYPITGARTPGKEDVAPDELGDSLIREETRRSGEPSTSADGS